MADDLDIDLFLLTSFGGKCLNHYLHIGGSFGEENHYLDSFRDLKLIFSKTSEMSENLVDCWPWVSVLGNLSVHDAFKL